MADSDDFVVKDLVQGLTADGDGRMEVYVTIHAQYMLDPTGDEPQIM
jgi:hypothetical protein